MFFFLWKLSATAAPVSPDVATKIFKILFSVKYSREFARKLAPTSLNARVGPWKSSNEKIFESIFLRGKSKFIVLLIMLFNFLSGISLLTKS